MRGTNFDREDSILRCVANVAGAKDIDGEADRKPMDCGNHRYSAFFDCADIGLEVLSWKLSVIELRVGVQAGRKTYRQVVCDNHRLSGEVFCRS